MTLKGNLKEFSFIQLLNLINLAKKSGAYILNAPKNLKDHLQRWKTGIYRSGNRTGSITQHPLRSRTHFINAERNFISRTDAMTEKATGIFLISANYVDQTQISTLLMTRFAEVVRKIFAWEDGFFRFEAGELIPDGRIPVHWIWKT
jgi:hypothetical protein